MWSTSRFNILTGWATMHCFTCTNPANSWEGKRHEVELLRTTSSPMIPSNWAKTFFFSSRSSGTHSWGAHMQITTHDHCTQALSKTSQVLFIPKQNQLENHKQHLRKNKKLPNNMINLDNSGNWVMPTRKLYSLVLWPTNSMSGHLSKEI